MTIVKWSVPKSWGDTPVKKEYVRETEYFYVRADKRRDSKISSYEIYFDSEAEALNFIADRNVKRVRAKEIDRIKSHAAELLEALELAEETLAWAAEPYQENTDLRRAAAHRLVKVRAAIAKAKGDA